MHLKGVKVRLRFSARLIGPLENTYIHIHLKRFEKNEIN